MVPTHCLVIFSLAPYVGAWALSLGSTTTSRFGCTRSEKPNAGPADWRSVAFVPLHSSGFVLFEKQVLGHQGSPRPLTSLSLGGGLKQAPHFCQHFVAEGSR